MTARRNEVHSETRHGCRLVRLCGEVDLSWTPQVRSAVLAAFDAGMPVGVDLAAVDYIDSSGIAALVEGLQKARAKGLRFALLAPSTAVRAVLELARLDRVFTIVDDASALAAPA